MEKREQQEQGKQRREAILIPLENLLGTGVAQGHAWFVRAHTCACDYSYVPIDMHFGRVTRWSCEQKIQHSPSHTTSTLELSDKGESARASIRVGSVGGTSRPSQV